MRGVGTEGEEVDQNIMVAHYAQVKCVLAVSGCTSSGTKKKMI